VPELPDRMYPAGGLRVRVDHMEFEPGPGSGSEPVAPGAEVEPVAWWEDGARWDGGYWNPGDGGEGWGTGDFPRRRRSRVLRATGFVVAVALVLGTVGTALELALGGSPTASLPVTITGIGSVKPGAGSASGGIRSSAAGAAPGAVRPSGSGASSGHPEAATAGERVQVSFTVTNHSGGALHPVCVVSVMSGGSVVGSLTARLRKPLARGAVADGRVAVPVDASVPAGSSVGAQVTCND